MRQWCQMPALKDNLFHCIFKTILLLSSCFSVGHRELTFAFGLHSLYLVSPLIFFYVAKTDHTDKPFCTLLIKSTSDQPFQHRGSFKVRNTVQLAYLCRGHVWVGWSAPGPLWARLGDPLHPITAGERLVGQWWAAGFVTLTVTACDPRVAWQAAVLPRGLRGSLVQGSGR